MLMFIFNGLDIFLNPVNILWVIGVILLFLNFVLFLIKSINLEMKSQKMIHLGYGIFCLFFGLTRLFFLCSWSCGNSFEGCGEFYLILGYLSGIMGIMFLMYVLETYLIKTRKIFTTISIVLFSISLIALLGLTTRDVALLLINLLLPFVLLAVSILFIYLIAKSVGIVRKKAIGLLFALFFLFLGHTMNTSLFMSLIPNFPTIIAPIVMIGGIIIFMISQLYTK